MPIHDTEISARLRMALTERIGSDRYELWFGSVADLSLSANGFIVSTANEFSRDLIRTQCAEDLQAVARTVFPDVATIEYRVLECCTDGEFSAPGGLKIRTPAESTARARSEPGLKTSARTSRSKELQPVQSRTRTRPNKSSDPATPPRRRRLPVTLESYITGASNALAATSARHVIDRPGRCSPLTLFGPTATGKTHLLEAIRTEARKRHPQSHVLYFTSEQFTSAFVDALRERRLPGFRHKLRGVDFLLIDDIHFFTGKQATRVEFQNTLDALNHDGKQVVLTSDRPLRNLADLGQDLISRLSGGLVCEVAPPDYATRLAIVRHLAARRNLTLAEDVLRAIAGHIATNARELSGALHRLHATSLATGEPITESFADRTLAELAQQNRPPVGLPEIEQAVCEVFGVAPQALRSKRTAASVAAGRTLAMWLARKYTRSALSEIGHYFGRRSHSTVVSAGKRMSGWLSNHRRLQLADRTCEIEEAIRCVEDRLRRA